MFYGWYIVSAGAILMAYYGWLVIYGFTAFVNPIAATFGWSYAQISLAMSIRGMETGILNPFLGMAVDRWPAKRLALIGIVLFGLGLFYLSRVTNLAMFYIGSMIMALGSSLAITMVPTTTIARWFKRDIGKASGILATGTGIGGVFIPLLVKMIDKYGWENALLMSAVSSWVIGIPLSFLFLSRPEDYGVLPDGKSQDDSGSGSIPMAQGVNNDVMSVIKTRAFWYIGTASLFQMAAMNAAVVHMMPCLTSVGMKRSSASLVAMLVPLVSLPVRIPFGMLADVFKKKYVMAFSIFLLGVGTLLFRFIDGSSFVLTLAFAITLGFGMGGFMPLRPPIIREYFGTQSFGTIFGLTSIFITIGAITSPPIAGWVYDTLGTYDPIWLLLGGLTMVGATVMLILPPAQIQSKPPTT
jgi:MFS family permease